MSASNVIASKKRIFIVMVVLTVLMVALIFRVGYWSIVKGEWLQQEAEGQWISDKAVAAKRGSILDRNSNVLAQSASSDTLVFVPSQIKEPQYVAEKISEILDMPQQEVYNKAATTLRKNADGTETKIGEVWVKRQISSEQSGKITALKMDGVKLTGDVKRFYPNKDLASQIIGYTNLDGEGQSGIERRYNSVLEGRQGRMVAETDSLNNDIPNGQEMLIEPIDGSNVILSIDEVVQGFLELSCEEAYANFSAESVQGLVMDVTNGEILGMENTPKFDLNDPPRKDSDAMSKMSSNIITASAFEPGNIFTIFTDAAVVDTNLRRESYVCTGIHSYEGANVLCTDAHGAQTVEQAVDNECSVAASMMAEDMGKEKFYEYLLNFGFGAKTGIDFATDTTGSVSELKYVSASSTSKMAAGEDMKVSQLQVASAAAALVNGGYLYTPRLVLGIAGKDGQIAEKYSAELKGQPISAETSAQIVTLLQEHSSSEDTDLTQISGYSSGTVYGSSPKYDNDGILEQDKEITTFISFAPASQPKYLVMITMTGIEKSATSSTAAAPYVTGVMEETLKYGNIVPDQPDGITEASAKDVLVVPEVSGKSLEEAITILTDAGLTYNEDGVGMVQAQSPAAGEEVEEGSVITLVMETKTEATQPEGIDTVIVPDFSGLSLDEARNLAISSGLTFRAKGIGEMIDQYPAYGSTQPKGTAITVTFRLIL